MILSDRETRAARARGSIRITPEPVAAAWSSTAVDLTLDGPLSCWEVPKEQGAPLLICPHGTDFDFAALSRQFGREILLDEQGYVQPRPSMPALGLRKIPSTWAAPFG
jgi:hypothetical protein